MPQLNVLPVNVLQNVELKDESMSFDSTASKDDFSKYIDLHLTKNKASESNSNVDGVKSETHIAKKGRSPTESTRDTKKPDDLVENTDANDEIDSATQVQKVAASGNKGQIKSNKTDQKALLESEQLMSFLTKADNTLINQTVDTSSSISSPEQRSVEKKAQYEAQLLLNSSNLVADLSAAAKALGKEQVDVTLAPTLTEQAVGKESTSVKLPIDSLIEGKSKGNSQAEVPVALVKLVDNKAVLSTLSELNTESTTGAKITNVSSDKISGDKTNIAQQMSNNTLPSEAAVDRDLVSKNIEHTSLTADQKIAKQIKSEHAQLSIEKTSTNAQSDNQNQTKYDAVKSLENAVDTIKQQINSSKPIQNGKVSSVSEPQLTNSELTQSSEITKANEKTNQATAQLNKTVLPSNQPTTSNLNHDDANKTQAKQDEKAQLSAAFAEQSQQKSAAQNGGEVFVEGKPIASVKIEPPANGHFIDVSGKATQTPQHIIEQQSAEMLSPSVATEVTQGQKTNTQLHQETISMFRKDFTEAVKDKVMLMISQKLQQFDITLDPPELGNMQVRVNLQGEQAVVSFLVQSQQTKDALEQNMHKLRELLAEQGVDVGDANVEQQSQQSTNEEGSTAGNNNQMEGEIDNMADANDVVAHTLSAQMIDSSTASVDYYA